MSEKISDEQMQLQLLAPWYAKGVDESRTLDFFDAIPKYPFPTTRTVERPDREMGTFTIRGERFIAEILPAQIQVKGIERLVFPGAREELVERALRFIAVQQLAKTRITRDHNTGREAITVFFTLSMIRRHLESLGHGYKISEIQEALDILSGARIEVRPEADNKEKGAKRHKHFVKATILSNYIGDFLEGDITGEESRAAVSFHPLATQAILGLAYYPINQAWVGSLKRTLARWLTTRMSHNYRQARKNGLRFAQKEGYHIALRTILDERGLPRETRLRDNLDSVREALKEMKERRILAEIEPYDEKLLYAPSKGRPKVIDAVWTLFPSLNFIEEIIQGNIEMAKATSEFGGDKSESHLLPGFQKKNLARGNKRESPKHLNLAGGNKRESRQWPGEISAKVPQRPKSDPKGRGK